MKADKVREIDNNELGIQERDAQEQMFRLRFQLSMGQTDGVKKLRALRKDRARMLTILREREINPALAPVVKQGKKRGKK
ncbi:MAG TPA: 50S ribosomal protein L29 [Bryobacteraceae bacterium]|nr:50S ribosomal protein L29 [Bryobacteraceae bacterium]